MILHEIFRLVSRFRRYISSRKVDFLWNSAWKLGKTRVNLFGRKLAKTNLYCFKLKKWDHWVCGQCSIEHGRVYDGNLATQSHLSIHRFTFLCSSQIQPSTGSHSSAPVRSSHPQIHIPLLQSAPAIHRFTFLCSSQIQSAPAIHRFTFLCSSQLQSAWVTRDEWHFLFM